MACWREQTPRTQLYLASSQGRCAVRSLLPQRGHKQVCPGKSTFPSPWKQTGKSPLKPIHPCPVFSVLGANDLGPRSCFREVDYSEDQECGEDLELEAVVRSSRGKFPECFDTSRSSELLGKGLEPALQNCSLNMPCAECGEIQKFSMPATTLRRTHMLARPDQRAKAGLGFHQMLSAESRAPLPPCSRASARAPAWPSGLTTPHSTAGCQGNEAAGFVYA